MGESLAPNIQLILNGAQLALYLLILALAGFKLAQAASHRRSFLRKFYCFVVGIASIEVGMQSYEVAAEAGGGQPRIYLFVTVNLYAITCEAVTIFLLADYWHQTKEIITKSSTEMELNERKHWARNGAIGLWLALYTAFVAYANVQNHLVKGEVSSYVLTMGCQGVGAGLMLWAIGVQVVRGHELAHAVGRYEEWLDHLSIRKVQFRCLYWMTSLFNLLRILFLIAMTVIIEVYDKQIEWQWFAAYVYTLTNTAVLLVYIFGFSADNPEPSSKLTTLLEGEDRLRRDSESSKGSKHETELSSSASHKSK